MKMNILSKLVDYIQELAPNEPSKDKIVMFLLGEKLDDKIMEPKYYYDLLKNTDEKDDRFVLSKDSLIELTQSTDWSCKRLSWLLDCKEKVAEKIAKSLKEKLNSDNEMHIWGEENLSIEDILRRLVYQHFFGTDKIEELFSCRKNVISSKYVEWKEKENELGNTLDKEKIVFVTGEPSNGRSMLVDHYFFNKAKENNGYINYAWLTCDDSNIRLSDYNVELSFLDGKTVKYKSFRNMVKFFKNKQNGYIVITRPILSDQDYDYILKTFKSFNMKIIVITRRQVLV